MTLLAIALVSLSALMHAGWNLLSKSQHPSSAFFFIATLTGSVLLSPALVFHWDLAWHGISFQIWTLLVVSGLFLALYFFSLAGAYRAGDMSIAYPIARAAPVLLVSAVTFGFGLGDPMSGMALAGIVMVILGCFLIPLKRFDELHVSNFWNATCGLALLAAIGTSGYSILDNEALALLRADTKASISNLQATLLYACLEGLAASIWLAIFVFMRSEGRRQFRQVMRFNLPKAIFTGVAIYVTYTIVLISLAFVDNVSYVVGFRQLSIPLGTTLGILILKESPHRPKLAGATIMFIGLLLLAVG